MPIIKNIPFRFVCKNFQFGNSKFIKRRKKKFSNRYKLTKEIPSFKTHSSTFKIFDSSANIWPYERCQVDIDNKLSKDKINKHEKICESKVLQVNNNNNKKYEVFPQGKKPYDTCNRFPF